MAKTLAQLAAKPELIKITIDDEDTIKRYEEPLEFYIYDRQPLAKFIKIATTINTDYDSAVLMLEDLVLDEKGAKITGNGLVLPNDLMTKVIQKTVEHLGK
jgi:hypothetical protein